MKKYLMTALTAVALSGLFTGCSKEMETNGETTAEADIIQTYENAFITRFGQPHENQTWGFGSVAGTRAVFANGNEWAANDRDDLGWKVPPALTTEQKNVVTKYFQTVKNPAYQDPHWTNYFIQQVYKGHSSPREGYSPEAYLTANGSTYLYASDYMDHLAAINGDFVDHNNNFNHGDCGEYPNVLDYKGTLNNVVETYPVNDAVHRHPDKINLMTNSTTASFGYYNSNGSVRRTEYTGLVSYQTIIIVLGDEAKCLDDGWNRSFMGFDFEQMVGPEIYAADRVYGNYSAENNWKGELISETFRYYEFRGQQYHMLSSDQNMYCGVFYKKADGSDLNDDDVKDEDFIASLLSDGYLPVDGGAGKKWVKVGGCADGYYSDWIVTLTEAQKYDTPNPPDNPPYTPPTGFVCRIIAEDLTVGENSDFDFNDVVFDVFEDGKILVRACGGTLPLTVAGQEVHALFGQSTSTMINTGWNGTIDDVNTYREINYGSSIPNVATAYTIPVVVTKKVAGVEKPIPLTAVRAKVASKIAVGSDYKWCAEREDIDSKYHKADGTKLFQQYVIGKLGDDWNAGTAWYQQK